MKEILLSIIIPCHQSSKTLQLCIDSLSIVKNDSRIEVILVDNNADRDTQKIIKDSGFSFIEEKAPGPGVARNAGALRACGKFLMFLDSDCVIPEFFLEQLFSILDQFTADAYQISIEPCDINMKLNDRQAVHEWLAKSAHTLGTFNAFSVEKKVPLLDSACQVVKKDVFHKLKGFPLLQRFEDRAYGIKLFEQGRVVVPLFNLKVKKIVTARTFWRLLINDWEEIKGQVWCEKRKPHKMKTSQIWSSYHFPHWSELKDLHLYLYHLLRKFLIPLFVWIHRLNPIKDNSYFDGDTQDMIFQVKDDKFSFNTSTHIVLINSFKKLTLIDKKNHQCTEIVTEVSIGIILNVLSGRPLALEDKIRDFLFLGLKKRFIRKI